MIVLFIDNILARNLFLSNRSPCVILRTVETVHIFTFPLYMSFWF